MSVESAEFIRCCILELINPQFHLSDWESFVPQLPINWVLDARSGYDSLTKDSSLPDDKRLAIDVASLRQLRREAAEGDHAISWMPGPQMPCDPMTKKGADIEPLENLMKTAEFSLVERDDVAAARGHKAAQRRERHKLSKLHEYHRSGS